MQADAEATADQVCAPCHLEIYERYRKTPMANASGPAADGFRKGELQHQASGVSYQILQEKGRVYLRFARMPVQTDTRAQKGALSGQRELKYFVGSGKRGRTYLFEDSGYWFESPVNWYAKKRVWDMAPNYLDAAQMPLTLPVDTGCLRCHASRAQASLPTARNKFSQEPFLDGGITCVACHGDPSVHLASGGTKGMSRISAMEPARRDSVCLSCHLEGDATIVHAGKRLIDFRPGDNLFDFASFFVRGEAGNGFRRASSQWEALLESQCKQKAGDKLTCTTCHDPHSSTTSMSRSARASFYRAKCLACHDSQAGSSSSGRFSATHHPENQDCTGCHMPRLTSSDIAHEQVTDHRLPRLGDKATAKGESRLSSELVPLRWGSGVSKVAEATASIADKRDLGLAYGMDAARGNKLAAQRALKLLREAEVAPGSDADRDLHDQVGFLSQLSGDKEAAAREYGLALMEDEHDSFALGNLALLKAQARRFEEAASLWNRAFTNDPVQIKAGLNEAITECGLGRREAAIATLNRVLQFSPDEQAARMMLDKVRSDHASCQKR